jgi:hypothetical protein
MTVEIPFCHLEALSSICLIFTPSVAIFSHLKAMYALNIKKEKESVELA